MAQLPPSHTPVNRCIAVDKHLALLRKSPEYRWRRTQIEREIDAWIDRYAADGLRSGLIRIPVVVHVVSNTAAQDISDAQIHSQIDVLNLDFRRLNADAVNTPAPFASVAADARLEFALAVRSPDCKPTNGITRTHTSVISWVFGDEGMKSAATNGADGWDPAQYLNIWVVNYAGGTFGYGTFPGMPAAIQGVVIDWQAFGTTGSLTPGAHLGRTATHEIGHYLDLHHIWGDDGSVCSDSDGIADTPNQLEDSPFDSSKCRTFPAVSCGNAPDGDMFMNYMDYSADQCFNMFTLGQVVRMDAALHTQRTTLLASPGLVPPAGIPGPDLWSKDVSDDMGQEPDTSTHPMYISDDIWVRQSNDGLANQDHQNPIHGQPSWVYVRVRNRSCGATQSGTVKLYWAKASSGLSWQAPWDGSVVAPALMGSPIGSAPVTVAGGDYEILTFPWTPPPAAPYAIFGADQHHFCLLSRIETAPAAPFGMTVPETSNLWNNVKNNNNIVWKNITIVDSGSPKTTGFTVANFGKTTHRMKLRFTVPRESPTVFDWGRVIVRVPPQLAGRLHDAQAAGLEWLSADTFEVLKPDAFIGGTLALEPGELHALDVRLVSEGVQTIGARVLVLDVLQLDDDAPVGGVRFSVRTEARDQPRPGTKGPRDGHNWFGGAPGHGGCGCVC
ncbi:MAG: hypothetical protein QOI48_1951 [Solirubrobacteraceae bacterium]|jgi:hypothetical protein|nr:hypothetical protein [Solirubrobacteraceae bacterium]